MPAWSPHPLTEGRADGPARGVAVGCAGCGGGCARPRGPSAGVGAGSALIPSASPSPATSNGMPQSISSRTRAGPSVTTSRTAGSSHSPAPATSVSSTCDAIESASLSTAATPPWAQNVLDCSSLPFATTMISGEPLANRGAASSGRSVARSPPPPAAANAARSPATPAPITSTSVKIWGNSVARKRDQVAAVVEHLESVKRNGESEDRDGSRLNHHMKRTPWFPLLALSFSPLQHPPARRKLRKAEATPVSVRNRRTPLSGR